MSVNWEDVDVPVGAYISWGNEIGQSVTGKVLDYSETGGTNFAGDPCPQLQVELTEPAFSINKEGQRSDFAVGEFVVLNCGLVSLKRAVRTADPARGDLVKITLANLVKTNNGTVKEMKMQVARGAGGPASSSATSAAASAPNEAPTQQQSTPPAGFDQATWAGLPEETRNQILAAQG